MAELREALEGIVGPQHVLSGEAIHDDLTRDEALTAEPVRPRFVVRPSSTDEVAAIVKLCAAEGVPLTARGAGTGLSGACIPHPDGVLVSFERMNRIVEIDLENHVAVVEPGLTLAELDKATAEHGFVYPVFPGENSASLGGNVATNAGGMRAVKYGVTRHHVIGLTAVTGSGDVIHCGGKFVKSSTGYDLTQLIIGSEGTLALVTEAIVRIYPRPQHATTVLAPFRSLEEVTRAVPRIVGSGVRPLLVEYIDVVTMAGLQQAYDLDLAIPQEVKDEALAYLVVVLEDQRPERLEEDVVELGELVDGLGALDVYVLPPHAGAQLIEAREKAFWTAKAHDANDIIDMVVPRAEIPRYMATVADIAERTSSWVVGCGHAGDGNVHLSVFQSDPDVRTEVIRSIFAAGMELGGAISGEHGIGREKKKYLQELEDPNKIALMRGIKGVFDPAGILNPGAIFDEEA